jgi:hypothetical protein
VFSAGQVLTVLNVVKGSAHEDGEQYGNGEVSHGSISNGLNAAHHRFRAKGLGGFTHILHQSRPEATVFSA